MTDTRQYIENHEKPGTTLRIVKTNLGLNGKNLWNQTNCSEPVRKDENLADQESLAFKETPQVTSPNYVKVEFTREF